ncbi:hypothetical protein PSA01_35520 [Pseudonocardia saturnea]|uniref:Uncharacterized protein n=2 Tax=Pseudonocardia TaxID=1847 RepID=A0A1Y2MTX2_PSEAH|nr:hypothetical protein BG845_03866 [Pseudonocardia autotrophica]BBF98805.1 hypothetical protein Pdca_00150 [Pseudonocardia autotrophica]GEC26523.1 hypothetical protein PSA01_35520 [Pseudonocardia saturnea]
MRRAVGLGHALDLGQDVGPSEAALTAIDQKSRSTGETSGPSVTIMETGLHDTSLGHRCRGRAPGSHRHAPGFEIREDHGSRDRASGGHEGNPVPIDQADRQLQETLA